MPAVTVLGDPARPAEGEKRNMGLRGGQGRVPAHGGGEGVGGIDKRIDVVLTYPLRKPVGPAEPPDAHVTGRKPGSGHAPGEGARDPHARISDKALGRLPALGSPPQNKHMHRHSHRNGLSS
ncbi:hypothetical protein SMICM304S_02110 [Streptomyces microflavus]